jgi:hypothetical protein
MSCLLAVLSLVADGLRQCAASLNTQRNSRTVGDVGLGAASSGIQMSNG